MTADLCALESTKMRKTIFAHIAKPGSKTRTREKGMRILYIYHGTDGRALLFLVM